MLLLEQEDEDPHHMFPLNLMRVRRWRRGEGEAQTVPVQKRRFEAVES